MKTVFRVVIGFLLFIIMVKTPLAISDSVPGMYPQIQVVSDGSGNDFAGLRGFSPEVKAPGQNTIVSSSTRNAAAGSEINLLASAERRRNFSEKAKTDRTSGPESKGLSLKEFVRLVLERNERISYQDSQWAISREIARGAEAIFEPAFVGSYQYKNDNRRNTIEDVRSQNIFFGPPQTELHAKSNDYQAAVEGLVPTGGRLSLGYQLNDIASNISKNYGVENQSVTFFGATYTQPLLKGGGIKPTTAGIRVAEMDVGIEFQNYREMTMRVISEAIVAYWDLYLAREKYQIRTESVDNAKQLLSNNLVRAETGKMAETEVLEAKAGHALRKSYQVEAKQQIVFAMNNVRNFVSTSVAEKDVGIEPTEKIEIDTVDLDFTASLVKAFKLRAEYLAAQKKIQREEIRLVFAKNQRWPQLDMKASYGLNGLATDPGSSWDEVRTGEYDTWSVGLEFRIPLGGDGKSRSELGASRQRKRQGLLELKAVEVAMTNTVDTAIRSIQNSLDQLKHYAKVVDFNEQLLDAEVARFKAGKSHSRILLEKEEDLNRAKEALLDSRVKYKKANMGLELAEGSLLLKYGIEIMKVDL